MNPQSPLVITFALLICFQVKHFLCDYPLQTQFMLNKAKPDHWRYPLSLHAGVHALFTLAILIAFEGIIALVFYLAVIDFMVHFTVDRLKVNYSRGIPPSEPQFWYLLGLDQLAHHLTHYGIIAVMLFLCDDMHIPFT